MLLGRGRPLWDVGWGAGVAVMRFGLWCPAGTCVSHCPLLCPSHAASPGQPGIPPQCHGGCRTGPDLSSRHYGKSHSKIPRQGIVLQGGGHEHTTPCLGRRSGGWGGSHTWPREWGLWHRRPLEGGMHEHPCPDDEPEQLHVGLPCA